MRWCKKCLEPDTRPDCRFNDEGICLPCRNFENFDKIDWDARHRELDELVDWVKSRKQRPNRAMTPLFRSAAARTVTARPFTSVTKWGCGCCWCRLPIRRNK